MAHIDPPAPDDRNGWLRRALSLALPAALLIMPAACGGGPRAVRALLRVDQVGYASGESKIAMLLAPRDTAGARAAVVDEHGKEVLAARIGARRGAWNARFPNVYPVDLSGLTAPGRYRLTVRGTLTAQSPPFQVGPATSLFSPLADRSISYFQAHRDGADQVPGPLPRAPAHLDDRQATVYDDPGFDGSGQMTAAMQPAGGTVDVEGGWYDGGDYLKFTHTTAYALIAMLLVQRDGPVTGGLAAETRHGLYWLDKMVDESTGTLYTQVGIGSGTGSADGGGFLGDHDAWRLPQADDQLAVEPGDQRYYQRYRPVFRAAAPGARISPNLAGRVAAAFALAAQVEARDDPAGAHRHLAAAAQVFALAETVHAGDLVTSQPRDFYPEDSWSDDMATAGTELALAARVLGDSRAGAWTRQAAHWARVNADNESTDELSVYNLSAIADTELAGLLTTTGATDAEIGVDSLRRDLRRRLDAGVKAAAADPMGAAAGVGGADYAAREFGWAATTLLYQRMSGDGRYCPFGAAQRGVALGANGWGTSLVVGAGTTYPHCPHDQIANLTSGADLVGAVVNGPNAVSRFAHLPAATSPCTAGAFRQFDRPDARYTDDVRASASSEPAIDFAATALLAFALTATGDCTR